jgi:hypothetical protein
VLCTAVLKNCGVSAETPSVSRTFVSTWCVSAPLLPHHANRPWCTSTTRRRPAKGAIGLWLPHANYTQHFWLCGGVLGGELVARYFRRRRPKFECFGVLLHLSTVLCELAIPSSASYRRSSTIALSLRRAISRRPAPCFGREVACNASFDTTIEIAKAAKIHVIYVISRRELFRLRLLRLRLQDSVALVRKTSKDRG